MGDKLSASEIIRTRPEAFRAALRTGMLHGEKVQMTSRINDEEFMTTVSGRRYKLVGTRWQRLYRRWWERLLWWR